MKRFNIKYIFLAIISSLVLLASCTKEYYDDGGVHNAKYDGTIMQFLKSRPELFDTLVKVIEYTKYAQLLNDPKANVTFFAPTNQSIKRSMLALNRQLYFSGQDSTHSVAQVAPEVWEKFLGLYIYNDKFLLKDYPQIDTTNLLVYPGQGYISISGKPMNIGTVYNDVVSKNSAGIEQIVKYAGYRQLLINYSNPIATSDIQPNNGVLHVLNFSRHTFGFYTYDFTNDAINKGIIY